MTARKARSELRAQVVKALAHPSRIVIAEALIDGEQCVCELTALVGADMSTVSKHLSIMKAAGLVEVEKRGLNVFYRLRCQCL
ncbi:MAG: metalloregulator ArsR/SmtB family transcription factor, partial [Terrimicrobiaceae bacterium]